MNFFQFLINMYARRGYVLETGNIVLEGLAGDLSQREEIKKACLGES